MTRFKSRTNMFKNKQWAVTSYGIEAIDGTGLYTIEANILTRTTQCYKLFYDWPIHMAEKNWVDIKDFIEAFDHALAIHFYPEAIDRRMLEETYAEAHFIAQDTALAELRTRAEARTSAYPLPMVWVGDVRRG